MTAVKRFRRKNEPKRINETPNIEAITPSTPS